MLKLGFISDGSCDAQSPCVEILRTWNKSYLIRLNVFVNCGRRCFAAEQGGFFQKYGPLSSNGNTCCHIIIRSLAEEKPGEEDKKTSCLS